MMQIGVSLLPIMPPLPALNATMQEFPPRLETLKGMTFPTIEEIIALLPEVELQSEPGAAVEYSNLGVALSTAAYLAWIPELGLGGFIASNTGKNPTAVAVALSLMLEAIVETL